MRPSIDWKLWLSGESPGFARGVDRPWVGLLGSISLAAMIALSSPGVTIVRTADAPDLASIGVTTHGPTCPLSRHPS